MSRARRSGELPRFVGVALRPWIQCDHMIVPGKILDLGVPDRAGMLQPGSKNMGGPLPTSRRVDPYPWGVLKKPPLTSRPAAGRGGVRKNRSKRKNLAKTGHISHKSKESPFRIAE